MIFCNKKLIPDDTFHVGVSGGIDSVAIAHFLLQIYGDNVKICHYNHNLRNRNNVMQKAVEWFCEDHNIELIIEKRQKKDVNSNVEDSLRKDRLKFFSGLNSNVILAHHLDDAIESHFMINFLNGKLNYTPIPETTKFFDNDKFIIRPFIRNRKKDLIDYVMKNNLEKYVVEDETNQDNSYRRNLIRNEILPKFDNLGLAKIVKKNFYMDSTH